MSGVSINRTTPPGVEPVLIAEARDQCRYGSDTSNDTALNRFIREAREECESFTGRALISQSWQLKLDAWPNRPQETGLDRTAIRLPRPPVSSITSFTYIDTGGNTVNMVDGTDYEKHISDPTSRLVPAYGKTWPPVRQMPGAIVVTFVAGYGADSTYVPAELRAGMLLRIETKDRFRGDAVSGTIISNAQTTAETLWMRYMAPGWA